MRCHCIHGNNQGHPGLQGCPFSDGFSVLLVIAEVLILQKNLILQKMLWHWRMITVMPRAYTRAMPIFFEMAWIVFIIVDFWQVVVLFILMLQNYPLPLLELGSPMLMKVKFKNKDKKFSEENA